MTTITNLNQLEDLISELTNKVNQLSQDMHDFKEKSRRENDGLRQKIADLSSQVEQLLHEKQPLKKEQPNDGVGLGGIAPTNLYRERRASEPEKYKFLRDDSFDDDKAWLRSIAKTSHKMGTLTEDFVEPILPALFKEVLNCHKEVEFSRQRCSKRLPDGRSQHYSLFAICGNYLLIAGDVSFLDAEYISMFREKLKTAREFLPEFADKQVIGALLTFEVDLERVPQGEREGFIMLGIIDGEVALLNQEGFVPKAY